MLSKEEIEIIENTKDCSYVGIYHLFSLASVHGFVYMLYTHWIGNHMEEARGSPIKRDDKPKIQVMDV